MGFDYHVLGRIDDYEKLSRMHSNISSSMEFVWVVSEELDSYMFTGILFNKYLSPKGFSFDFKENHKWEDVD